ncbi:subtilisin-like protease SBT4.6 [Impatiens glandulifera]|uniref:subtilisin-like protease SBT4.6 n=1 Tax=Impatiens glandulifera TaxID=253017 RepID=UPI001FB1160E|nr:subtilisin-like protease SBT4.6 [Impatiens glandulifera]
MEDHREVHIVYMGSLPEGEYLARSNHISMIQDIGHSKIIAGKILLRSYKRSFNGFVANLTPEEVLKLKSTKGVVSVFKRQQLQIQTTRSWDYIGLSLNVSRNPIIESNIIIGHFDSGVTPESDSFSDHGLGPVPKKWKGVCAGGKDFTCNRKIIGARYYAENPEHKSARDINGHGTHTASTAIGRVLKNASFFGIANGTARGGVPTARIAVYRVCSAACKSDFILAAFDDAIADKVDIITISVGADFPQPKLSNDVISIGSFHAIEQGILTVNSAGNEGRFGFATTDSFAPWVFTVAASTDRTLKNKLILGNGKTLMSTTVNAFDMSNNTNLVYGTSVGLRCNESSTMQCMPDCVDPHLVKGKIIVCDSFETSMFSAISTAERVGASGVVLRTNETSVYGVVALPTAILNDSSFLYLTSYLNSKTVHMGRITKSEMVENNTPLIASYSSRGPNRIFPEILKPDITAPGTYILAAFIPSLNPSSYGSDSKTFKSKYNLMTGTSMACPHVAGAVAYVKSKHPDWSFSAIKSSLMTSAWNMNSNYNLDDELGHGAGHIDPVKALNPGLVYETSIDDYFKMFCSLGSEGDKLIKMFKGKYNCPKGITTSSPKDLNYPTMTTSVHKNSNFTVTFLRVVTNVGNSNSTYHAETVTGDSMVHISVKPSILSFVNLKEKKSFLVTVSGQWLNQNHISCSLIWSDEESRRQVFGLSIGAEVKLQLLEWPREEGEPREFSVDSLAYTEMGKKDLKGSLLNRPLVIPQTRQSIPTIWNGTIPSRRPSNCQPLIEATFLLTASDFACLLHCTWIYLRFGGLDAVKSRIASESFLRCLRSRLDANRIQMRRTTASSIFQYGFRYSVRDVIWSRHRIKLLELVAIETRQGIGERG